MVSTFCDPTTYHSPLTTHHSPLPVVGLIGGIGSGKSVVAEMFRQRGAKVISGDLLGHEALCQPDIRAAIVRRWGAGVLKPDETVCRRRLGEIVFANPQERRALETLVFPWISTGSRKKSTTLRSKGRGPSLCWMRPSCWRPDGTRRATGSFLFTLPARCGCVACRSSAAGVQRSCKHGKAPRCP